ncbi:MAG: ATP-binding cassette domain-containing protein [Candidatus Manganitrophus sp.]|nr:MAG: ATP-binding cassette domain-containing protein [Candidatus Manganitrophus sp.]
MPSLRPGRRGNTTRHLDRDSRFTRCSSNSKTPVQTNGSLLQVTDLKVHFPIHKGLFKKVVGHVKAVDGVSLSLRSGRTIALVGESGCGKTTTGKAILQLIQPTGGKVRFEGDVELTTLSGPALREKRGDCRSSSRTRTPRSTPA